MASTSSVHISKFCSIASVRELLESCSVIADGRVFILDVAGNVAARSGSRDCECPLCINPPDRIESVPPTNAEIRIGETIIGRVCSCRVEPNAKEAVAWLARDLSAKAADQVDLDSMSEELLNKYEEVNLVYDVSEAIASVFDEVRIAELVLERIMKAIGALSGAAVVEDKVTGDFRITASIGVSLETLPPARILFDKGVCGRVIRTGKPMVIDVREGTAVEDNPLMSPPLACSPLIAQGRVLGVIILAGKAKPQNFSSGDLKLLSAISSQMGVAIHNARLVEEAKKQERFRRELEIAASIQASLLPESPPEVEGIEIVARSIAAERVGGDYYGFFGGKGKCFSLVIADVSGRSIAAALMAATVRSVIRVATAEGGAPAEVVARVNRMIYADLVNAEMLVSMLYAAYDERSSALAFANAGHERPMLCRGSECSLVEAPGLILGVIEEQTFPEGKVHLRRGDIILFYTDGLTEAENDSHEQYREERLKKVVSANASFPLDNILDACLEDVRRHAGKRFLHDDVTMVAIRRK